MSRRAPIPSYAVQHGSDFFSPAFSGMVEYELFYFLQPNETEWSGPYPEASIDGYWKFEQHLKNERHRSFYAARDEDFFVQVQTVGRYLRMRRLPEGPVKKLSDWKQLTIDVPMLVNPMATRYDYERALSRANYLRDRGFGIFVPWIDEGNGLWVNRVGET